MVNQVVLLAVLAPVRGLISPQLAELLPSVDEIVTMSRHGLLIATGRTGIGRLGHILSRTGPQGPSYREILSDDKTLALVDWASADKARIVNCTLFDVEKDRAKVESVLGEARHEEVRQSELTEMLDIIDRCRQFTESQLRLDRTSLMDELNVTGLWSLWSGILPGTKWCGLGDFAQYYDDVGPRVAVDVCCRAHDHCPVRLRGFHAGYGLVNFSVYTKSHCDCDTNFYKCLKAARSETADIVGNFYFNIMKTTCLAEYVPVYCMRAKRDPGPEGPMRCVEWRLAEAKKMHFIDPELFY